VATRAAEHLAAAAARAMAIGDLAAMNRLLQRATSSLPTQDPQRTRLLPLFENGLAEVGRLEEALAAIDEVLASDGIDPVTRAEALELAELQFELGRSAIEVQPMVDEALRIRRELGDENGIARALFARAHVEWFRGSLDQSARMLEEALALAQSSGDLVLEAEIRQTLLPTNGISRHGGPREPTPALELIEFARKHGNILMELGATRGLALNEGMRGNRERALALFRQTDQMSQDLGMAMPIGWRGHLAFVEEWFGNTELALANLEEHARSLRDAGERGYLSSVEAWIARFNIDLGRLEEAREAVRLAEEAAAPDDVGSQVEIRADRARIRAREGDLAGAEELARESIAGADATDYINLFVISRLALADVLRLAGRKDEALTYVEEAAATEERRGGVAYSATIRRIPETW
jgi:tetratricopeptide (TPR) repeat protein